MTPFHAPSEESLYKLWESGEIKESLATQDGLAISVLEQGQRDRGLAGPDFKNAKLRIGNITYIGDVEIDMDYSDWVNHGHYLDKRYNSVILHLTLNNKKNLEFVFSHSGRRIYSICLSTILPAGKLSELNNQNNIYQGYNIRQLKCARSAGIVDHQLKVNYLASLGVDRFQKKCNSVYARIKELAFLNELTFQEPVVGYDLTEAFYKREFNHTDFKSKIIWQQLFYELLFEALGFSKNKNIMLQISKEANLDFLKRISTINNFSSVLPAALLYVSGLIPDTQGIKDDGTLSYIKFINEVWEKLPIKYDGMFFQETDWNFFSIRPSNFPTLRLVGGAQLLGRIIYNGLLENIVKIFKSEDDHEAIINSVKSLLIVKAEGFWSQHFNFGCSANERIHYLVGSNRADEIMVNVVFPFVTVFSEVYGNQDIGKKSLALYTEFIQPGDNNIIEEVQKSLLIGDEWKKSVVSQGMIELYRSYCQKSRCLKCKIGKMVFN